MSARRVLKLVLGFALGFVGACVTLEAIDRFGTQPEAEPLEVVLSAPDFDGFCRRDGATGLRAVVATGDAAGWRCAGTIGDLWATEPITADDVCRWQYGAAARARLAGDGDPQGWLCVTDP